MPRAFIFMLLGTAVVLIACSGENGANMRSATDIAPYASRSKPMSAQSFSTDAVRQDDLMWLVGRWRCITRQYIDGSEHSYFSPLDFIEYFNVYLPYADKNLTLNVTGTPFDRQIAAELLARQALNFNGQLEEILKPVVDGCPIYIGTGKIWTGYPSASGREFRFFYNTNTSLPRIVLEGQGTRTVFERLPDFSVDDMARELTNSTVCAPIKDYSVSKRMALKREYDRLISKSK